MLGPLILGIAIVLGKVSTGLIVPDIQPTGHWEAPPDLILCSEDIPVEKSIDFWSSELGPVSVSETCPEFIEGSIVVTWNDGLERNVRGKTVMSDGPVITRARVELNRHRFREVTLGHEIGHALGLPHTPSDMNGSLMNPNPRAQRWKMKR